jgi:hypothetical protein
MTLDPDIFESLFHCAALRAFVETAVASGGPPNPEATKWLAYRHYEEALAEKNAARNSLYLSADVVAD